MVEGRVVCGVIGEKVERTGEKADRTGYQGRHEVRGPGVDGETLMDRREDGQKIRVAVTPLVCGKTKKMN